VNALTGDYVLLSGRNRSFDIFNGGPGTDVILGTPGADALFLDDSFSLPGTVVPRIANVEIVRMGDGDDVVDLTSNLFSVGDIVLEGGNGNDVLWSSVGLDLLQGGAGNDRIDGGKGNDVEQGGEGSDSFDDRFGRNAMDGGAGADVLSDGDNASFLTGGRGNDMLQLGRGADVVAFNKGDGQDTVSSTREAVGNDTLSLGGGIRYADLGLRKSGNDLMLEAGSTNGTTDRLTLRDWYAATPNRGFINLQVVAQAMADFNPVGGNPLLDNKVETFNFAALVQRFDAERAKAPSLTRWDVASALAAFHIGGSDSQAIGGDLAYYAGMQGNLAGMSLATAQGALANPDFGIRAQAFGSVTAAQDGMFKLV
jgi:hypothetical protein